MAERPILMSAPMIRALLAGTKTQTRRALRGFFPRNRPEYDSESGRLEWFNGDEVVIGMRCPYGQPGDLLWVRETHAPQADCWGSWERWARGEGGAAPVIHYAADAEPSPFIERWRPSIHMPRWASRITLRVTDVRVERLQDTSEADAIAEGITPYVNHPGRFLSTHRPGLNFPSAVAAYRDLWESIHGPGSWEATLWVWVMSFERVEASR